MRDGCDVFPNHPLRRRGRRSSLACEAQAGATQRASLVFLGAQHPLVQLWMFCVYTRVQVHVGTGIHGHRCVHTYGG